MVMIGTGLIRQFFGTPIVAESAHYGIMPEPSHVGLTGFALLFFALRAFACGTTALTGVEAVANGVPAFSRRRAGTPRSRSRCSAAWPCTMFAGVTALALIAHVHYVDPLRTCDLIGCPNCATAPQRTVIAQMAAATFGGTSSSASSTSRRRPRWS